MFTVMLHLQWTIYPFINININITLTYNTLSYHKSSVIFIAGKKPRANLIDREIVNRPHSPWIRLYLSHELSNERFTKDNVHGSAQCITNVKYKIKPDSNNSYFNNGEKYDFKWLALMFECLYNKRDFRSLQYSKQV